jgi:hypothetical protein
MEIDIAFKQYNISDNLNQLSGNFNNLDINNRWQSIDMEKNKTGSIVKALNVIWLLSLLIFLNSCKKDRNTDIKNPSNQVFSIVKN